MARKKLGKIGNEERHHFTGIIERTGYKNGYKSFEPTLLLLKIRDESGHIITDHLWFNYTKGFLKLGTLKQGDVVEFDARVGEYIKGYKGYNLERQMEQPLQADYKLQYPTKIKMKHPVDKEERGDWSTWDKRKILEQIVEDNKDYYIARDGSVPKLFW